MKRLGEILMEQGSLTKEKLEKALNIQKKEKDKKIGTILIEQGFVTEEEIVIAFATQFSFAYLPLENISFAPDIRQLVPADLARKSNFIPIDKSGSVLTIAMADPSDEKAIAEIEKQTGTRVQAFVSTITEIDKALRRYFGESANDTKSVSTTHKDKK